MARGRLEYRLDDTRHKLTVLAKDEVVRRLGELSGADRIALSEVLRHAFSLDR
jgi:hypothetical protein